MLPFSPDGSENPCEPSRLLGRDGSQDCSVQRERCLLKCLIILLQKDKQIQVYPP